MSNNQDKSSHGGKRSGAGRKKGSLTQKTREVAEMAASQGVTPLEVMLEAMNSFRENGDIEKAAGFAKDAAPYMHPRLASVDMKAEIQNRTLDQAIAELDAAEPRRSAH